MGKRYRAIKCYGCYTCGKLYSPTIYAAKEDVARQTAIQAAQRCCEPESCKRCGGELDYPSYAACRPCREILKLRRAEEVEYSDCDAPIFSDDVSGSWGEGYSGEIHELEEYCEDANCDLPCYVHPCIATHFKFDPADVLDRAHDNHHEDAVDQIEDVEGLFAFFKEWNAKQSMRSYFPDYKKVIVLDRARFDEMIIERDEADA